MLVDMIRQSVAPEGPRKNQRRSPETVVDIADEMLAPMPEDNVDIEGDMFDDVFEDN
jgi:hypothetical protein